MRTTGDPDPWSSYYKSIDVEFSLPTVIVLMPVLLQATSRYALTSNHEACARRDQASNELHTAELALLL